MAETRLSIGFPQFPYGLPDASEFVALARRAEALGFDALWVGERLLTPLPMFDPIALLAHLAAVTSRIRLGTSVVILPLRPPVQVAKAAATLDHLSAGRFVLGVAPGGDFPQEFESCGVPVAERGPRTEESIALLRHLWREPVADFEGRFYRVHGGGISPRPLQEGGPPIWIGGRGKWAIRCAATLGDSWCPSFMPAARFRTSWEHLCELAVAAGRDPATIVPATHLHFYVGSSFEVAAPVVTHSLSVAYQRPYAAPFLSEFCVAGSADDCREAILRHIEAGVRYFVLAPTCPPDQYADQFAAAAEALLPLCGGTG